jgi:hypothetical protein
MRLMHRAPRKGFYRCRPIRLARMGRAARTLGKRDALESFRVWSHRLRGRAVRYVHNAPNGRTHRANVYRTRATAR